jgi:uncharacterized repeat protein (TIGR03803 family)
MDRCFYGIMGGTNRNFSPSLPATNHATVFQFTTNGSVIKLYSVTNGPDFTGLPVEGPDGYLYGTTLSKSAVIQPPFGNYYDVSIYRLSTNGDYQIIHTRSNALAGAGDLIFGSDGSLYGTISSSRLSYPPTTVYGSIFRVSTAGVYSNFFTFGSTNGANPGARLLLANDGYLYGTTSTGGISNYGTIFRISTNGGLATLVNFLNAGSGEPSSPLIQADDGNFYGTTESSKFSGIGTIFRLVQPTAISNFALSNTTAALTWNSFPQGIYRVDYKSNLWDTVWTPLVQRVTATDLTITVFDNFATSPQRLYRVVLLP